MRTLLILRLMGNRGESPPPGFKRGLAPDRIFHLGGRARRRSLKLLAVLCPRFCEGPWVSERAEAKENRKIPWNALLSRRMLAHGSIRGNETREKRQILRGKDETSSLWNCGKSFETRTKLQGLVAGILLDSQTSRPVGCWRCES